MALHVQRQRGGERVAVVERDVLRLPAGLRRGAAGFVQRMQEGVAEEGVVLALLGEQAIPGRLADLGQGRGDMRAIIQNCFHT